MAKFTSKAKQVWNTWGKPVLGGTAVALTFTACDKDEPTPPQPPQPKTTVTVPYTFMNTNLCGIEGQSAPVALGAENIAAVRAANPNATTIVPRIACQDVTDMPSGQVNVRLGQIPQFAADQGLTLNPDTIYVNPDAFLGIDAQMAAAANFIVLTK